MQARVGFLASAAKGAECELASCASLSQLNPEDSQILENRGVAKRSGIHGAKADRIRELPHTADGVAIVANKERVSAAPADLRVVVNLGAEVVEPFDDGHARERCGEGGSLPGVSGVPRIQS